MQRLKLGWVDFSKEQRKKVLSVMDLLSEPGAIDELGVGTIRDAFANRFFPGTSTIQTRAKYFLIVPYLLYELENGKFMTASKMISSLEEQELALIELLKEEGETGIIGQSAGKKLKRKPSNIYWNGIRKYEIFTGGKSSLTDYARGLYINKKENSKIKSQVSIENKNEENGGDDRDAIDSELSHSFWNLPTFDQNWRDDLSIRLRPDEAEFLRERIIRSCPHSLMGFILKGKNDVFCEFESFDQIGGMINILPQDIRQDYLMAKSFADFIIGAHIRYNIILSEGKNVQLNEEWDLWSLDMEKYAGLDLDKIFKDLEIRNRTLKAFLLKCKAAMTDRDIEGLDEIIIKREKDLKGLARAKLCNRSEFDYQGWVGINKLQYRWPSGQMIIKDIYQGLGESDAKSI